MCCLPTSGGSCRVLGPSPRSQHLKSASQVLCQVTSERRRSRAPPYISQACAELLHGAGHCSGTSSMASHLSPSSLPSRHDYDYNTTTRRTSCRRASGDGLDRLKRQPGRTRVAALTLLQRRGRLAEGVHGHTSARRLTAEQRPSN